MKFWRRKQNIWPRWIIATVVLILSISAAVQHIISAPKKDPDQSVRVCSGSKHFRSFTVAATDIDQGVVLKSHHLLAASALCVCCPCDVCKATHEKLSERDRFCHHPNECVLISPSELVGFKTKAKIRKGDTFNFDNLDLSQSTGFLDACICEKMRLSRYSDQTAQEVRLELKSLGLEK